MDDGTKRPVLPFGLSIRDLGNIPALAIALIACCALWLALQTSQQDYKTLAESCAVQAVVIQTPVPAATPTGVVATPTTPALE